MTIIARLMIICIGQLAIIYDKKGMFGLDYLNCVGDRSCMQNLTLICSAFIFLYECLGVFFIVTPIVSRLFGLFRASYYIRIDLLIVPKLEGKLTYIKESNTHRRIQTYVSSQFSGLRQKITHT
jgi:hypothetical protein